MYLIRIKNKKMNEFGDTIGLVDLSNKLGYNGWKDSSEGTLVVFKLDLCLISCTLLLG